MYYGKKYLRFWWALIPSERSILNCNKAIILAAGSGTRLGISNLGKPKCLQVVGGKALVQWQIEVLEACGIADITIATGFSQEALAIYGSRRVWNESYQTTNMVYSLYRCIEHVTSGPLLITYGDVLVDPRSIRLLVESNADFAILSDANFLSYWSERNSDPISDLETFELFEEEYVLTLGGSPNNLNEIQGQYMGLTYVSKLGFEILKKLLKSACSGKTLNNRALSNAYMTDLLQELINSGLRVKSVPNELYWIEIDTARDLEDTVIGKRIRQIEKSLEFR